MEHERSPLEALAQAAVAGPTAEQHIRRAPSPSCRSPPTPTPIPLPNATPELPSQDITEAAQFEDFTLDITTEEPPKGLEPEIVFSVQPIPKLSRRAPTGLDDDVSDAGEQSADEFSGSSPGLSLGSSPTVLSRDTIPFTPPDLRLGLKYGDEPVREQQLHESDCEPDNEVHDALDSALVGDASSLAARAARTGHGLPHAHDLRRDPNRRYEASTTSKITDLGRRERDRITHKGHRISRKPPECEEERKRPIQERLLDIIVDIPGHEEKKGFFPETTLLDMIDEQCVEQELRVCFPTLDSKTIHNTAREVCGTGTRRGERHLTYKKIFVTLVLSEKSSCIRLFIEDGVSDDDLPLCKIRRKGKWRYELARKRDPENALKCFQRGEWNNLQIMRFEEWQWTTLAPFFNRRERKNVGHWILQDQIPLPFTADSRFDDDAFDKLEFEGGNSTVFKVDIHPEHHSFIGPHGHHRSFAIKSLRSRNINEFSQEVDTLKKFSDDAHPHLISLLATYGQHNKYYLIFPWADAHLKDFWEKTHPHPTADYNTILWVAVQCLGIAEGLLKIHHYESSHSTWKHYATGSQLHPGSSHTRHSRTQHLKEHKTKGSAGKLFGRHGDIKPENILWFQGRNPDDKGILKITDFGLTEFSHSHSNFYKPKSKIAMTPSYRAPEGDLEDGVGPSSDIWSLGCIFLEFITWLLGGRELLSEFYEKRLAFDAMFFDFHTDIFFEIVKSTNGNTAAMVKPAVTEFIDKLHSHPNVTTYIHEFLDVIQEQMLVIKPPDRQDHGRSTCQEVYSALYRRLEKCKSDIQYTSSPCPWSRLRRLHAARAVETDVAQPAAEILQRKQLRVHDGPTCPKPLPDSPAVALCRELVGTSLGTGDRGLVGERSKSV